MCDLTKRIIMCFVRSHIDAIMRVVSVHIINFKNRIDALHLHRTPTKAKLNARTDTTPQYCNAHSVWTDATRIITHHNVRCWTSVDRPLEAFSSLMGGGGGGYGQSYGRNEPSKCQEII